MSNQSPDFEHLEAMLVRIATNAGALPVVMTMDAGYWSESNVNACAEQGIDGYVAKTQPAAQRRGRQDLHGPQAQK